MQPQFPHTIFHGSTRVYIFYFFLLLLLTAIWRMPGGSVTKKWTYIHSQETKHTSH
jgi:hypothetical protein